MKTILLSVVCLVPFMFLTGCRKAAKCTVTQYGSNYMTYTGPPEQFDDACRAVLRELSYKESAEKGTRYPYYGEGASTQKDKENDRSLAVTVYLKTKDADMADYKITTLCLGNRQPIVMLESTATDPYKLINALNAEFAKRDIRVRPY